MRLPLPDTGSHVSPGSRDTRTRTKAGVEPPLPSVALVAKRTSEADPPGLSLARALVSAQSRAIFGSAGRLLTT